MGTVEKKLRRGATLVFFDESGYSLTPFLTRTWARKGTVPVLEHALGKWEKLSVISAVAVDLHRGKLRARLFFRMLPGKAFRGTHVAAFYRQLTRHLRGEVFLVGDNARQHHSKAAQAFEDQHPRFHLVFLPPYCPELNPDEGVWNWSKTKDLVNACPANSPSMKKQVLGSMRRIQRRGRVLRWCLAATELPWGRLLNQGV